MKICLVRNYIAPAKDSMGAERVVESLAKGLMELEHEVVMKVDPRSTYTPAPMVQEIPKDCDLIHFHSGWDPAKSPKEYDSYGIPWVVTLHGGGSESNLEWLRTVVKNPHIICVSKFISARLSCPAYVWTGSDPADFQFCEEKEDYFLWMAGTDWEEGKGLWSTIRLAKKLGIKLKIAGTGKNKEVIEAIKNQCNNKIEYIGSINGTKKAQVLSKAKALFLLTNLPDACPVAVGEAYLSGTPVIASNNGAMPEIVFDKQTGFICDNDIKAAKAIAVLSSDKYKSYPEVCRSVGVAKFSHTAMAEKYLQFYQNMLDFGKVYKKGE